MTIGCDAVLLHNDNGTGVKSLLLLAPWKLRRRWQVLDGFGYFLEAPKAVWDQKIVQFTERKESIAILLSVPFGSFEQSRSQ